MRGKSYKLTNVHLKIGCGRKIPTTKQTTITEINEESLTAITIKEHNIEDPLMSTALIRECTTFQKILKVL